MLTAAKTRAFPRCTRQLFFRQWSEDDERLAFTLWGDPTVDRFSSRLRNRNREATNARLRKEIRHAASYGVQLWPVLTRDTHELIGCVGLRRPVDGVTWELAFQFPPVAWQQGWSQRTAAACHVMVAPLPLIA